MNLLALAWLSEIGLMSYRIAKRGRPAAAGGYRVIWPADLAATFVVFGALSLVAEIGNGWDNVAAVTGWGFVVATVINLVDPAEPTAGKALQSGPTAKPATTNPPTSNPLALALGGTS